MDGSLSGYDDWLAPGALAIYLFHGVISEPSTGVRNYTTKHLDARRFRDLLATLRRQGEPVAADGTVDALTGRSPLPDNAFLVSFDDGFKNNLEVAAPILEELEIPAVFYVTTSFLQDGTSSWIDLIEFGVERTEHSSLPVPWSAQERPSGTREEKIALLDEIRSVVKGSDDLDPYAVADGLLESAGVGRFEPDRELDRKLSWDDARELDGNPLFEIGGHSHTHRILAHLNRPDLDYELSESMELLERELGRPVRHYSYPEGLAHSYSDEVIEALRGYGIVAAPTAEPGVNEVGDDLFRLKRIMVPLP